LVVAAAVGFPARGWAAGTCTFYVRAGFTPVSGTADGRSPASAFPTIAAGAHAVHNPGDLVCVGPGTYVEGNIGVQADGASGTPDGGNAHPVELRADPSGATTGDPPGPVRIEPPGATGGVNDITTAFLIAGRHDIVIAGFQISGFSDAGIQVRPNTEGVPSANVTVRGNSITGCRTGIDITAQQNVTVESNVVTGSSQSGISVESCLTETEFGKCRNTAFVPVTPLITNNRSGGNAAHGIFLKASDDAVIQNNVVYANGQTGISVREAQNTLVGNNLVYRNGQDGVAVGKADLPSPGTVLLNNTLYANGSWAVNVGSPGAGSPRAAVVNNIVWRNGGDGSMGIGVLNENSGLMPVRPASICGFVEGFNLVLDDYGPDTPYNAYDRFGDPLFADPAGPDGVLGGEGTGSAFVDRSADDDFHLRQLDGEGGPSPALDAGSATVAQIHLTGSTASDGRSDSGVVDMGFHYGAAVAQVLGYTPPFMPFYVTTRGSDSGDGLSPETSFAKIDTAAQRARGGVTVVVGPGTYHECNIAVPPNGGKVTLLGDASGASTGQLPGAVVVDAGACVFDAGTGMYVAGENGFAIANECNVVIDGFHVGGATEDAIRVDDHSDDAEIRNNVAFGSRRGIHVINSDDVHVIDNLAYGNEGGIVVGGKCPKSGCAGVGSPRAVVEFNTAYESMFNGIQVGDGSGLSPGGTVRYNVTGKSGKDGIAVGDDTTRSADLQGFTTQYNLLADRYATGVPRGLGDLLIDTSVEPLYVDPSGIVTAGDWLADTHFRLVQTDTAQSRAVDYADVTAAKAGLSDRSTQVDGMPDTGAADLGYHYPARAPGGPLPGDCNGDGHVTIDELVRAVNIALGQAPVASCAAIDLDGDGQVGIDELVRAIASVLEG
jgi:parallel beta-helix repeat protein